MKKRFIVLIQVAVLFFTAVVHVLTLYKGRDFEWYNYLLIQILTLSCCLFVLFVFLPLVDWVVKN
jgi:hypothetical protein